MTLNHDQCVDVIKKYNAGIPAWSIAATMGITRNDIRAIRYCKKNHLPLTDYKFAISDPEYKFGPLSERPCAWDLRLSMKLARLPMSKWAEAL